MTGELSPNQLAMLRGLEASRGWTLMSARELGDPDVSTLQSLELVKLRHADFTGWEWRILDAGKAALHKSR